MKSYVILSIVIIFLLTQSVLAQQPFSTKEYVDINNIKTAVLVHGDMNWDPFTSMSECEFPKASGKHLASATTIWMAGYDQQSQLRVSAQTYRQSGNDFWPGPLNNGSSPISYAMSNNWARIWKVAFFDINNHIANSTHTASNTPKDIWEWPAKGNPNAKGNNNASLNISDDMAPYVDVNNDGKYNAADGDYPAIKGDQMLWWVFNDNGPTHDNVTSQPLQLEVYAMAYAYKRNTLIDNIVFYDLQINNTATTDYSAFRIGLNADMDLGYFHDDYIGFDSSLRLGYVYNGLSTDGTGQANAYGTSPPVAGYTVLQMPGDNSLAKEPIGSFMFYNNDGTVIGNPTNATEYNNYLRTQLRNNAYVKNDYAGYGKITTGMGPGPITNYYYPGNPTDTFQWSECSSNNPVGDRRFILATNDFTFTKGSTTNLSFALVVTDTGQNNTCPDIDVEKIRKVADSAWKYYSNPPKSFVSVETIATGKALGVYPNPTRDMLHINAPFKLNEKGVVLVYDAMGRNVKAVYQFVDNQIDVNVTHLPMGVYSIQYIDANTKQTAVFVKE